MGGRPGGEEINPCDTNSQALTCSCEDNTDCDVPGNCIDGVCTDCTGQEGCYCGVGGSCEMGLLCNDSGLCEYLCGNVNGPCCPADRSPNPCSEGLECVEDVCQMPPPCGGDGEACCDEGDTCAGTTLRCGVDNTCVACIGETGCACDAGACLDGRCEADVCVACDGELGCSCDEGDCQEGRCEADVCVACDGEPGCPCDNGVCVNALCGDDNICVACTGQEGCECAADGDCAAGLDCVTRVNGQVCEDCPGQISCRCNNGECDGNLTCEDNECAQPLNCPAGTQGCPCDNGSCEGTANCVDLNGDGETSCTLCLGSVGCYCNIGAICDAGGECENGYCVEVCDEAGCPCEGDDDCVAPFTCEAGNDGDVCTDCRGQIDCACTDDQTCEDDAICNEGVCIAFEAACELERSEGCLCGAADQECAVDFLCLDGACAACDNRGDLTGCPCPNGICNIGFYCDPDNNCVQGQDCDGDLGATCLGENRACVQADGQRDADCAECLANFIEVDGDCVACNADQESCPCINGVCDPNEGVYCGANDSCVAVSVSAQDCADQSRGYVESDGSNDAGCGDCLDNYREPEADEEPNVAGACVSCLGEVGCACDNNQCDGDAVCQDDECISFEESCGSVRGSGCDCNDVDVCAEGNLCIEGGCVSCEGRDDLAGCACIDGACDPTVQLFCNSGVCALADTCAGDQLAECDGLLRLCAETNGRDDARCTTCKPDISVTQGEICYPCNGDAVNCPCVNSACQSTGNDPNSLYCAVSDRCVTVTRTLEECTQRNRVYVSDGIQDASCGACVEGAVEVDGECRVCDVANPQHLGCSCQGVENCTNNALFCNIATGYTCSTISVTLEECAELGEGYDAANGTNDASCSGVCLDGYSRRGANNLCLNCQTEQPLDPNCDGCVNTVRGDDGQCRDKLSCADCEANQVCTPSGDLEVDDSCSSCQNGEEFDESSNSCVPCPCDTALFSTGEVLGTTIEGRCICEPADGYYIPDLDANSPDGFDPPIANNYVHIQSCDEDNDGWISQSAYGTHPLAGEQLVEDGVATTAQYNRCRINVITQVTLEPSVSPRAEGVNPDSYYRPATHTETIEDLWTKHGLTEDPTQAAKLVVMVEPDKIDRAYEVEVRTDNKLKLPNAQTELISITPSALNPFTKACGRETDFNLSGYSDDNDFIDRLKGVSDINTAGYDSEDNQKIDDLKLLMTDLNYYIELYHGSWEDCDNDDVRCTSPKSQLIEEVTPDQYTLIRPVTYRIIERNRPTQLVIPNEVSRIPFTVNGNELQSDAYNGWEECTVYGDTRTVFTSSQGVEIDLKLGNEFNNWRRDYTRPNGINGNTNAADSAEVMASDSFRTVLRHHSQFKCVEVLSTLDFQNNYDLNDKHAQDTVLYFGNPDSVSVDEDVSEQALLDNNIERYVRQTCWLSEQPNNNGVFVPSADGKPVDLSFECSPDTSAGSGKVQWAIMGYRDNNARKPVGDYNINPMIGYIRGCINECAASRGRFLRECAKYGIFNDNTEDKLVACTDDSDCRNAEDYTNMGEISPNRDGVTYEEKCGDNNYCWLKTTTSDTLIRMVNRRKDATAQCISDLFDEAELVNDGALGEDNEASLASALRAPYVCRGYDYNPDDALAFIPTSCQVSAVYNGVQRCGCADGYAGVDAAGNLDCSYGCPGAVPNDGTGFLLSTGDESRLDESAWFSQIIQNSNPNEDPEVLRYKKFIQPPEAYWMCLEPGGSGSEPLTSPEGTCSEDEECEIGGTCNIGTCTYPPADEYQLVFGGVPGVLTSDPARPFGYDCRDDDDCSGTDGTCTNSVCVY